MCVERLPERFNDVNAVYFLRNVAGPIPYAKMGENINDIMANALDIGYFSGHSLIMLEQVLSEVYMPLIQNTEFDDIAQLKAGAEKKEDGSNASKTDTIKMEVIVSMQKFVHQISHTAQQVTGETKLNIPDGKDESIHVLLLL